MDTNIFRAIMNHIDEIADPGVTVELDFLVGPGKVTGTWQWLADPDSAEYVHGAEVIVVTTSASSTYVPVANIIAIQVRDQ